VTLGTLRYSEWNIPQWKHALSLRQQGAMRHVMDVSTWSGNEFLFGDYLV